MPKTLSINAQFAVHVNPKHLYDNRDALRADELQPVFIIRHRDRGGAEAYFHASSVTLPAGAVFTHQPLARLPEIAAGCGVHTSTFAVANSLAVVVNGETISLDNLDQFIGLVRQERRKDGWGDAAIDEAERAYAE